MTIQPENALTRNQIGRTVRLNTDYETALTVVTDALKAEGFGVLTEIDVKATLKKKLDVDFRPYKILGACNPPLAHRALEAAPEVGLLLPCNVTVQYVEDGVTEVSLIDPMAMLSFVPSSELAAVATDAAARLDRVAAALGK
jgi:uncharacterized protein (DUF302 family)